MPITDYSGGAITISNSKRIKGKSEYDKCASLFPECLKHMQYAVK